MADDCVTIVPFSHYDWTFARVGWLPLNPIAFCLIASFCALAYWMSIELLVLVYVTFKRHSGTYFWSIIITTCGIIFQTTGYILKEFENSCPPILTVIICKLGWVSNVTGFSIVLWSRLHLVINDRKLLKIVLCMILINGVLCHTPIVVFEFGLISSHHNTYFHPMEIMERIQQTIFTLQETFISSLYIYHAARLLNGSYSAQTRNIVTPLVCVQLTVIALDALLTVFDYTNKFTLKCTIHPFVYSIKLKLEFIVLNQLQTIVKRGLAPGLGRNSQRTTSRIGSGEDPGSASPRKSIFKFFSKAEPGGSGDLAVSTSEVAPQATLGISVVESIRQDVESPSTEGKGSDEISEDDDISAAETDLRDIVGSPDDDMPEPEIDDLERQYLGRFNK